MTEIAVIHAQSGIIDYLNIVRAHATTDLGISELIPTMLGDMRPDASAKRLQ